MTSISIRRPCDNGDKSCLVMPAADPGMPRTLIPKPCIMLALDFSESARGVTRMVKGLLVRRALPVGLTTLRTLTLATLLCMDYNCKPFHSCLQVR